MKFDKENEHGLFTEILNYDKEENCNIKFAINPEKIAKINIGYNPESEYKSEIIDLSPIEFYHIDKKEAIKIYRERIKKIDKETKSLFRRILKELDELDV